MRVQYPQSNYIFLCVVTPSFFLLGQMNLWAERGREGRGEDDVFFDHPTHPYNLKSHVGRLL